MGDPTPTPVPDPGATPPLPDRATEEVLHLAVVRDLRTIDRLIDALSTPREGHVLLRQLEVEGGLLSAEDALEMDADALIGLKQSGKRMVSAGMGEAERLIGSWKYIVAVAAGLAAGAGNLSSSQPGELRPIMLDLAEATADSWRGLFRSAADRCVDRGG